MGRLKPSGIFVIYHEIEQHPAHPGAAHHTPADVGIVLFLGILTSDVVLMTDLK